jgi:hypothetical protein
MAAIHDSGGNGEISSLDDLVSQVWQFFANPPDFNALRDNDEFMSATVAGMSRLLALGKITVSLERPRGSCYSKRFAPHVGLMVRIIKLYEGILHEACEQRAELASVFYRPFFEAIATQEYLMRSGPSSARSFIETSYRPEQEMLVHLNRIKRTRKLDPIEVRMLRSVRSHLRHAGISQRDLLARRNWKVDGLDVRALLKKIGWEIGYTFGFASSSHWIHPSWCELFANDLTEKNGLYTPKVAYTVPDPRLTVPPSRMLAGQLLRFVRFFEFKERSVLEPLLEIIAGYFHDLDAAHEELLAMERGAEGM